MTTRLAFATLAAAQPMGQQVYERELRTRAPDELGSGLVGVGRDGEDVAVTVPGTVRVPVPAPRRRIAGPAPGRGPGRLPRP